MRLRRLLFVLLLFIGSALVYGQTGATMDIQVIEPLPELPFATFVVGNTLPVTSTIFTVSMDLSAVPGLPPNAEVQIYGEFAWQDIGSSGPELMAKFLTEPFRPRNFTNTDLGRSIRALQDETVESVINRNLRKGKPVGSYYLTMWLHFSKRPSSGLSLANGSNETPFTGVNGNGTLLVRQSLNKPIEVVNPTQTLIITEPQPESIFDAGNVTASWSSVQGVSFYKVKAYYKRSPSQSLDDALRSGEPIINDVEVGLQTSVNLRTLMTRDWTAGKTVVMQVVGVINGIGQNNIYSQPISFNIRPQMNAAMQTVLNSLSTLTQTFSNSLPPEILNMLVNGGMVINEIRLEDGSVLSETQVQAIVTYLQAHPGDILNVTFRQP